MAASSLATPKQLAFMQRLCSERGLPFDPPADLSSRAASTAIDALLKTPRPAAPSTFATSPVAPRGSVEPLVGVGLYQTPDGTIYRVKASRESGRPFASQLVAIGGTRVGEDGTDYGTDVHYEYQYAKGAIFQLTPAMALSLDDARAWGIRTGTCCVCAAKLTDAVSVRAGIGPVCVKKFSRASEDR